MNGFSEHIPGRWSSHPASLRRQRPLMFWGALIPILLMCVLGVYLCVDFGLWQDLIRHPFHGSLVCKCVWLKAGAMVVAFATGALFTMSLLYSLSLVYANGEEDDCPFPRGVLVLTALIWLLPVSFSLLKGWLPSLRNMPVLTLVVNLMCFVPMLAVLLWIKMSGRGREETKPARKGGGEKKRSFLLLFLAVLSAFVAALAALPVFVDVVKISWGCGWLLLALIFWVLWLRSNREKKSPEATSAGKDAEPEWIERLKVRLPVGVALEDGIQQTIIPNTSRPDLNADSELLLMMDGKVPTLDQSVFFRRFRDGYETAWKKLLDSASVETSSVGCDLLLSGVNGSGRTEILLACALYSSLVRGNGTLFIVESKCQAECLAARLNQRIANLSVGDYLRSDVLTKPLMDRLLEDGCAESAPGILFATPDRIEDLFFSNGAHIEQKISDRVRDLMFEYSTVMVDDFCSYSLSMRVEVAFLMDKWRLVLANGLVMSQFVTGIDPVFRPDGAYELGKRLYGAKTFSADNDVLVLRPRESKPYWSGSLRISAGRDVGVSVREILKTCLDEGLAVVYYSKGMSGREKSGIVNEIEAVDVSLRLVSSLDEIGETDRDSDAVLYLSLTSGNAAAALRLRTGETQAVFLKIVSDSESAGEPMEERLLPLPDETAVPLRVHHLKSVLPFIPLRTPVSAEIWSRFGISLPGRGLRHDLPAEDVIPPAKWTYDSWTEPNYPRVAPYLVLEHLIGNNVEPLRNGADVLPNPSECMWIDAAADGAARLLMARPENLEKVSGSLIEWRDDSGNPLGESDLSHAERLECRTEANTYVVDTLDPAAPADTRYTLIARGQFSRGAEYDYVIPERSLTWEMDVDEHPVASGFRRFGELAVFAFDDDEMNGITVRGTVSGLSNAFGRSIQFARRDYHFRAYASCLVFSPLLSPGQDEVRTQESLGPLRDGCFSTEDQSYSTFLTHAFAAALRWTMDGAAFYASTPVFRCVGPSAEIGKAVVWFLEPLDSGRSLHPLFSRLLGNSRFFRQFVDEMKRIVSVCDTVEKLRAASGQSFRSDICSEEDRQFANDVLGLI